MDIEADYHKLKMDAHKAVVEYGRHCYDYGKSEMRERAAKVADEYFLKNPDNEYKVGDEFVRYVSGGRFIAQAIRKLE